MKKNVIQLCCLFTFLTLTLAFITIGDKKAKLKIEVFIDITEEPSGTVIENLIKSIEKTCVQVITNSLLHIKIYPILSVPSEKLQILSNYLNYLEEISSEFEECKTCTLKKFVKMSYYLRQINRNHKSLKENNSTLDILKQIINNIDSSSLKNIVNDKNLLSKFSEDMNSYNSIGLKSPLVSVNSVNLNSIENVNELDWIEIFKINSSEDKIKCEDSEDFINRLKYY